MHKRCTSCLETLPLESFAKKRHSRAPRCKACHNAYARQHYQQHRTTRVKEIRARNKEVSLSRLVLVRALTSHLHCHHCGKNVWLTPLNKAARLQVGEAKFRAAAASLEWKCRSNPAHTGIFTLTPTDWLEAVTDALMPIESAYDRLALAISVSEAELDNALNELLERQRVFSPLRGWIQPTTSPSTSRRASAIAPS
jgi:hypothetical protein